MNLPYINFTNPLNSPAPAQTPTSGGMSFDFLGQLSASAAEIYKAANKNYQATQLGIAEANARAAEAQPTQPRNNTIWIVIVALVVIVLLVLMLRR